MIKVFRKIENRFLRIAVITLIILFIFVAVVIIFISPISKYLIEKYSEKYTGRQIKLSWIYVNPFTGGISAHGVQIFENKSQEVFIKAGSLSVNLSVRKLFSKSLDLSSATLDNAWVNIIQRDSVTFNFTDL